MPGWLIAALVNVVTAVIYVIIAGVLLGGLSRSSALRPNRLAVATCAVFLAGGLSFGYRGVRLLQGTAEVRRQATLPAMIIALFGAAAGLVYLALRAQYAQLLRTPSLLDQVGEQRYRQLASTLPQTAVYMMDRSQRIVLADGDLSGLGISRAALEGRCLRDVLAPEAVTALAPYWSAALAGRVSDFDYRYEPNLRTYRARVMPSTDESGEVVGGVVFTEDVTEEREVQARLAAAVTFNDAVIAASPDITVITDAATGELTWSSRSVHEMLGWSVQNPAALPAIGELIATEDHTLVTAFNATVGALPSGQSETVRYRMRGPDGAYRWISCRSTPFEVDAAGNVSRVLSILRDVTDAVSAEQQLQYAALHDPLTGLPNRTLLMDRIASAIDRVDRSDSAVAVLFCDLDRFKRINDSFGHPTGDAVLVEFAERLRRCVRRGDSVARVGGDEFVVVLEPQQDAGAAVDTADELRALLQPTGDAATAPAEPDGAPAAAAHPETGIRHLPPAEAVQRAERIARRILEAAAEPYLIGGGRHSMTVSVGMAYARRDSAADDVLRDADAAMYAAKQQGGNRHVDFNDSMRAEVAERDLVETTLRQLLSDPDNAPRVLAVAYQPIYDLANGGLAGFEALARLSTADGNVVPPEIFIPVAENSGLIIGLGATVLDRALGQLAAWRAAHPGDTPGASPTRARPMLSVNLSARQAQQDDLAASVLAALTRHGLEPRHLTVELTESILLETGSAGIRQLADLHAAGVGVAIDDFGTGYASLSYLASIPITSLKVDRSFTAGLPHDPASATIVRAVVTLAAELGLTCVIEGIETEAQLAAMPAGVLGQGYLLGRPSLVPVDEWRGPTPEN